jgi:hypothetical protein
LLGNSLLKHFSEGNIAGRIEVAGKRGRRLSSYCMTLTKRQDTANLKRTYQIELCGDSAFEENMDLS